MIKLKSKILINNLKKKLKWEEITHEDRDIEFILNIKEKWKINSEFKSKVLDLFSISEKNNIPLTLEVSYFWDEDIKNKIIELVNKGILINIIISEKWDIQNDLNRKILSEIYEETNWRINIYFYPKIHHAKIIYLWDLNNDNWITLMWSANLMKKSIQDFEELNILINNKNYDFNNKVREQLKNDIIKSKRIKNINELKYNFFYSFIESNI